jgi:hypothetical protein
LKPNNQVLDQDDGIELTSTGYLILDARGFEDTATSGKTALMIAVLARNIRMVGHMLNNSFDPNAQDDIGYTALMYAAKIGNLEISQQLILRGSNLWLTNQDNETAIQVADRFGNAELANFLRNFEGNQAIDPAEVTLLEETLADGYVIAVKSKDLGLLPVVAVAAENTEVIVITVGGDELKVLVGDCEEELTVQAVDFQSHFSPAQVAKLLAA